VVRSTALALIPKDALDNVRDLAYVGELTKDERNLFVRTYEKIAANGDAATYYQEAIDLMEEELIPHCTTNEPKIFYMKTVGEIYEKLTQLQKAKQHYEKAVEVAKALVVTHPERLNVVLDLAKLLYKLNDKQKAIQTAHDE
jgi:tetratricopeptide (TPR) repeat protein